MKRTTDNVRPGNTNAPMRDRWVSAQLALLPAGTRLLDAGAGEQKYRASCGHLVYVSQDNAEYNGVGNSEGLQMGAWDYGTLDIVSDITAIPEPDQAFGAILCTEVLEHLPDPTRALDEFVRLLQPGGTLLLTAPICSMVHFAPSFFSTGFSAYYYEHQLTQRGMIIEEITANGNFFSYLDQLLTLYPSFVYKYTTERMGPLTRLALSVLACRLRRQAVAGSASSEILCFGLHVKATKRGTD